MTLRMHVLAGGQADSIILELPSGRLAVVDFGHTGLLDYLQALDPPGERRFAFCVLTHAHDDHYRSLDAFIDRHDRRVDEYWFSFVNGGMVSLLLRLQAAIAADHRGHLLVQDTAIVHPRRIEEGIEVYRFAPPTRDVLRPPGGRSTEENNRSIVLLIRYGACTVLLGADAEDERWLRLTAQATAMTLPLTSDVVKAPHHGAGAPRGMPLQLWPVVLKPGALVAITCRRAVGKPDAATIAQLPRGSARCTGRAATCAPLPPARGFALASSRGSRRTGLLARALTPAPETRRDQPCFGAQVYTCDPTVGVTVTTTQTPAFLDACI